MRPGMDAEAERQPNADRAPATITGRRALASSAWHVTGLVLVVLGPPRILLNEQVTDLASETVSLVLCMGIGYGLALALFGGLSSWRRRAWVRHTGLASTIRRWAEPLLAAGVAVAIGFGLVVVLLEWGLRTPYFQSVVVASAVLAGLLLVLSEFLPSAVLVGGAFAMAVANGFLVELDFVGEPVASAEVSHVLTAVHGVSITTFPVLPPEAGHPGGGIHAVGEHLLVASGSGSLYVVDPRNPTAVRTLSTESPLEIELFLADTNGLLSRTFFRAMDVTVRPGGGAAGWTIYLSHHVWHGHDRCVTMAVSVLDMDGELQSAQGPWRRLYETSPCLPVTAADGSLDFAGQQSGGRMAWLDGQLLLTTGDHDGLGRAQDPENEYGKTLLLDPDGVAPARAFTRGHRNPQALHVDEAGRVWETEHGPQGGDELNLLQEGQNYGWPLTTLGTNYGRMTYQAPENGADGAVDLTPPTWAWIPSPGISSLLTIRNGGFPRWDGDLLVGSLRDRSLFRIQVEEERVVAVERIPIGVAVRDMVEDPVGDIWIRTDGLRLARLQPNAEAAETFAGCTGCHSTVERWGGVGPSLAGISSRAVATVPNFEYSPALSAVRGRWTRDRLDAFLTDPQAFAPGTSMNVEGVADPERREAILDYLESLR